MELKDKFNSYQTEVDEEAWENFRLLRKHQKSKKKPFFIWWVFAGALLVTCSISVFQYSKQIGDIKIVDSKNKQSNIDKNSSNNKAISFGQSNKLFSSKNNKSNSTTNTVNINKTKRIKNQIVLSEKSTLTTKQQKPIASTSSFDNNKIISKIAENSISNNLIEEPRTPPFLLNEDKQIQEESLLKIERPILKLLSLKDRVIPFENLPPIIKPLKKYSNNTLKIGLGYADAYLNGFSLDNMVNKKGIALQLEYYHEWNKIIGTGLTVGYINMLDRANPNYEIKDRESIKFIHANLYLFLVNEQKHRLYAKLGAGPTNTDRVLGAFLIPSSGEIERTFQINNITNIGFAVEGAYEYQINRSIFIGANYGIISHNDGGQYAGLSISYQW